MPIETSRALARSDRRPICIAEGEVSRRPGLFGKSNNEWKHLP
jgi:hypothetical protein